jgi:hypothetical protein
MSAEHRLEELGIALPAPPEPFGTYAEAGQTNNLLFLTGMLPTQGRGAAFIGRSGRSLTSRRDGRRLASQRSTPWPWRAITSDLSTSDAHRPPRCHGGDVERRPRLAEGRRRRFRRPAAGDVRKDKNPSRLVYGVASR